MWFSALKFGGSALRLFIFFNSQIFSAVIAEEALTAFPLAPSLCLSPSRSLSSSRSLSLSLARSRSLLLALALALALALSLSLSLSRSLSLASSLALCHSTLARALSLFLACHRLGGTHVLLLARSSSCVSICTFVLVKQVN
jgi:hypothetical protein